MAIQYGIIVRTLRDLPCDAGSRSVVRLIPEGEEVTVGNQAGGIAGEPTAAWWVQHRDGRKSVAFEDELEAV